MGFIDPAFMEGAQVVARAVEHHARQAVSSTVSNAISSATSAVSSVATSSTTFNSATPTTLSPTASTSAINGGSGSGGNGTGSGGSSGSGSSQSSPLLFFVALGFGVVFTNLWIIVGVKYCFRYNARNRAMRLNEDGEPINLENMPRPHRRRREKKLMTIDEVNEKFPMLKYKSWVAGRAQEGLPTQGGVSVSPSRANSIRDVEGIVSNLQNKERESIEAPPDAAESPSAMEDAHPKAEPAEKTTSVAAEVETPPPEAQPSTTVEVVEPPPEPQQEHHQDTDETDDDDDEHINAALPPDLTGLAGDSCAICIDTLEDDDDVRGLTCGHAFHAVCLDPWLTTRRACCPLCKADYYTPKPRPSGAEGGENVQGGNPLSIAQESARQRMNLPTRPGGTWFGFRGLTAQRGMPTASAAVSPPTDGSGAHTQPQSSSRRPQWLASLRGQMPFGRDRQSGGQQGTLAGTGTDAPISLSQLEAGIRPDVSAS